MTHSLIRKLLTAATALAAAFSFTSCQNKPQQAGGPWGVYDVPAKRPSNPGAVRVYVSTGAQRVYVKEGDRVLMAAPCCVGTASDPTPAGTHRIYSKTAHRRRVSSPGAGYPMPFWCEFKTAYGFHGGWVHPYPASHGCIRLPWKVAPKFYNLVSIGTPVNIARSQPEDATIGRSLKPIDDRPAPEWPGSILNTGKIFEHCGPGRLE